MKTNFRLKIVLFLSLALISCHKNIKEIKGSLNEALSTAKQDKKHLIVIAENEDCRSCEDVYLRIKKANSRILNNECLLFQYNRSLSDNKLLFYLINSVESPSIIVFSPDGVIENIISGDRNLTELKEELGVTFNNKPTYSFYYPKLNAEPAALIKMYNDCLKCVNIIANKRVDSLALKAALSKIVIEHRLTPYFFNTYLVGKMHSLLGDSLASKEWYLSALSFNKPYDLYLYGELRKELQVLVDSNIILKRAPILNIENTTVDLGQINFLQPSTGRCIIKNVGKMPLIIKDIKMSCDCINVKWNKEAILPNHQGLIEVTYNAKSKGDFSKILFVVSNAENEMEKILIKGHVN